MVVRIESCGISSKELAAKFFLTISSGGAGKGAGAFVSAWNRGRSMRERRLDIALDNAAMRTRTSYRRNIEPQFLGDPARERRGESAWNLLPVDGGAGTRHAGWCCRCHGQRCLRRGFLARRRLLRRLRRTTASGGRMRQTTRGDGLRVFPLARDQPDDIVDRHIRGALRDHDLGEHAFVDRFHFHCRFVGLDLGDHIAGLTLSPSFFSQRTRLPFSMVGESAGMRTSIGMARLTSIWVSTVEHRFRRCDNLSGIR